MRPLRLVSQVGRIGLDHTVLHGPLVERGQTARPAADDLGLHPLSRICQPANCSTSTWQRLRQSFPATSSQRPQIPRSSPNPSVTERAEAEEAIKDFEDLELAQSVIRDRKAARDGLCVAELRPADPKAVEEARALFAEVFGQ
jgi:hypothetical protein